MVADGRNMSEHCRALTLHMNKLPAMLNKHAPVIPRGNQHQAIRQPPHIIGNRKISAAGDSARPHACLSAHSMPVGLSVPDSSSELHSPKVLGKDHVASKVGH